MLMLSQLKHKKATQLKPMVVFCINKVILNELYLKTWRSLARCAAYP